MPPLAPAAIALQRLKHDQALRGLAADRRRLETLALRLDIAGRGALTAELASRVHRDRRFVPVLQGLVRLSLG